MSDEKHRLLTLANTAALLLFTEHGNPPALSLSQKVLAEHGANLLGAYKETVVEPAMTEIGIVAAEALQENGRLREALRKQAVISRHRMTAGGGSVHVGFFCEICEAECDAGQPLIHVGDCPLTAINPSQISERLPG